eukprot:TRINITY_DN10493_c0_g1_i1.p1 TRINITY_DN10493_c0_g1~~TRINITY_DN10493_c0_g1_i1.p1  ORF type:complete len:405 (-),score=53.27 TRINITY_DN10493_c0_g1_i1:69-1283(-)
MTNTTRYLLPIPQWDQLPINDNDFDDSSTQELDTKRTEITGRPASLRMHPVLLATINTYIADNAFEHLLHLDLHGNNLQQFPSALRSTQLPCLTHLELSHNSITTIPWWFASALPLLTKLNLSHNMLTSLPSSIGDLSFLTDIDVSDNQLTELPAELGYLKGLQRLWFQNNCVRFVPSELSLLPALVLISLNGNPWLDDDQVDLWYQQVPSLVDLGFRAVLHQQDQDLVTLLRHQLTIPSTSRASSNTTTTITKQQLFIQTLEELYAHVHTATTTPRTRALSTFLASASASGYTAASPAPPASPKCPALDRGAALRRTDALPEDLRYRLNSSAASCTQCHQFFYKRNDTVEGVPALGLCMSVIGGCLLTPCVSRFCSTGCMLDYQELVWQQSSAYGLWRLSASQ